MHAAIAAFPSLRFYDGHLKTSPQSEGRRLHEKEGGFLSGVLRGPVRFINVEGWNEFRGTSLTDEGEAGEVARVVQVAI
jgi:superfamily I DNA and/or RNA helicase